MPISKPTLPPRRGYVEVEINGIRQYSSIFPEVTQIASSDINEEKSDIDLLADAYREGVNES